MVIVATIYQVHSLVIVSQVRIVSANNNFIVITNHSPKYLQFFLRIVPEYMYFFSLLIVFNKPFFKYLPNIYEYLVNSNGVNDL